MGDQKGENGRPAEVDYTTRVVIVGAGPAGASLAAFLGSYGDPSSSDKSVSRTDISTGITGIIISQTTTTAQTPRAHLTNAPAMGPSFRDF